MGDMLETNYKIPSNPPEAFPIVNLKAKEQISLFRRFMCHLEQLTINLYKRIWKIKQTSIGLEPSDSAKVP